MGKNLIGIVLFAQILNPPSCKDDFISRWNKFVDDANIYIKGNQKGIIDVKLRLKVEKEWERVVKSECW
jgi:hypothetical protein